MVRVRLRVEGEGEGGGQRNLPGVRVSSSVMIPDHQQTDAVHHWTA